MLCLPFALFNVTLLVFMTLCLFVCLVAIKYLCALYICMFACGYECFFSFQYSNICSYSVLCQ